MEQETLWPFIYCSVVTKTLRRIRMRERLFPNVSKCLRRLTATTSFVREAAERESSGIVYLKKVVDDRC